MVSNYLVRRNNILFLLTNLTFVLLLYSNDSLAQNLNDYYTSNLQSKGTVYFIYPQSDFLNNNNTKFSLSYDITCISSNDTATLNFSYYDVMPLQIDSISLIQNKLTVSSIAYKIFVDTKGNKFHYRYSTKFLLSDLIKIFNSINTPKIRLLTTDKIIELNIKDNLWKKQSEITSKIFTLIKYNK